MKTLARLLMLGIPLAAQVPTTITLDSSSLKKVDSAQDSGGPARKAPGTVLAELLRKPLPSKARQMLLRAQHFSDSGEHMKAVELFEMALAKYPNSAAWTQSLLGVEYLKLDRIEAAVISFDQAVALLPHDPVDRFNLGLSLVLNKQYTRAGQELTRALELDPGNAPAKRLLDALRDKAAKSVAQIRD